MMRITTLCSAFILSILSLSLFAQEPVAVSYTHLDVYKRQGMGSVLKWRLSPNPQRKEKKTVKWDPKAVSYTHLDSERDSYTFEVPAGCWFGLSGVEP